MTQLRNWEVKATKAEQEKNILDCLC